MIFIGLAQTAPLKEHLVFVGFEKIEDDPSKAVFGRITFAEISDGTTRIMAQFNDGFISVNVNDYKFLLGEKDLSSEFREQIVINPPGTTPYKEDFNHLPIIEVAGKIFEIKLDGKTIGKNETRFV